MNKINLLFIVFFLLNFTMLAQQGWFEQNHLPTVITLYDVDFVNATNGWAVGVYGTIIRTTDGGKTWIRQISGNNYWLNGVSFTDINNGTVVGEVGTILRTTDGGENWISQTSGINDWFEGVYFYDSNNGWIVGY